MQATLLLTQDDKTAKGSSAVAKNGQQARPSHDGYARRQGYGAHGEGSREFSQSERTVAHDTLIHSVGEDVQTHQYCATEGQDDFMSEPSPAGNRQWDDVPPVPI